MLTIAIVDNHTLMRNEIKGLVNRQNDLRVTIEASGGRDFIRQLETTPPPDIALVDINMPHMDGYEITVFLKDHFPSVKVLGVSFHHDDKVIRKMLHSGACGYVTKTSDPHVFIDAIHAVADNGFFVHNHIALENAKRAV